MLGPFHELAGACFAGRLDEDRANRLHAEGFFVFLLPLDEVIVRSELLEHVGHGHRPAITLIAEVKESLLGLLSTGSATLNIASGSTGKRMFHRVLPTHSHSFHPLGVIESPAHSPCCRAIQLLVATD